MIVGIGASAGGLNAFKGFFARMPVDSGMAFVLVQHLSPDQEAYSIAIVLREAMEHEGVASNVQIFATDIDDQAVALADAGSAHRIRLGAATCRIEVSTHNSTDSICPNLTTV